MTAPQTPPVAVLVVPEPGSRLEQLAAHYELAKAEAEKAAEAFEAIKAGIKAELAAAAPDATDIRLASDQLAAPLQLRAVESWRIESTRLKKDDPATWVRYAKKSTSWRLAAVAQ